ncbi:hypothetical protein PGH07_06240 [Sulfurovum sp. zt1-1]|uniref:Uncharacterized protein n=1 Tax=Sulfurovum zhangzhouensis TaxID=3019067 RepID=A0ABT7QY55_9BACT|nr:hypothetical protein [Sulfurovum zhangzhouensis]MDM5271769.1 hypothetical protein [Sulfurovum zhangzhouensis]
MKRNEFRKSLKKIKKKIDTSADNIVLSEFSEHTEVHQNFCTCKDAQGQPKMLYPTLKEAEEELVYLNLKNLRIYPCPIEKGWHLTKG